jgi:cytoskeletal protein RodZ
LVQAIRGWQLVLGGFYLDEFVKVGVKEVDRRKGELEVELGEVMTFKKLESKKTSKFASYFLVALVSVIVFISFLIFLAMVIEM